MSLTSVVAIIDIGKTNAKVALVEVDTFTEVAVATQPNAVLATSPYPHFDVEHIHQFIIRSLGKFSKEFFITAISVTTHGACGALLGNDGNLSTPIIDYEFEGFKSTAVKYDEIRPDFSETGSARLPGGLNLGAQIYWLFETYPDLRDRTKHIVTYAQYWVYRLTGIIRNELTSLGCHTDLWNPMSGQFSSMIEEQGWSGLMAPVAKADELIGPVKPELARELGLRADIPVYCGIHDSNASLYPHLISEAAPFSVVSTGTWVISMAIGGAAVGLDPTRDTLINVNGFGEPVPSSRFMGGREFETLMENRTAECSQSDIDFVLQNQVMLLPSVVGISGPYPGRQHCWTINPQDLDNGQYYAAVCYYLALMTASCLALIGSKGKIIVEGPFAKNAIYCKMLATATSQIVAISQGTGTSIGAAMLTLQKKELPAKPKSDLFNASAELKTYAEHWIEVVNKSHA